LFLIAKVKSRSGNRFSCLGKPKSVQEITFPVRETRNPTLEIASRAGKAKFHPGNPFPGVSSGEYRHHCRLSCLGREFRLDEPQRKKDFRNRPLQAVKPAPPSLKDQAFDQQGIEEHQEWRRNDPPA